MMVNVCFCETLGAVNERWKQHGFAQLCSKIVDISYLSGIWNS